MKIERYTTEMLFQLIPLNIYGNLLVTFLIALYLRDLVPFAKLAWWFGTFAFITAARHITLVLYRKSSGNSIRSFYLANFVEMSLSALLWGITGFIIFTTELAANTVITVTMMGVVMAGMTALSSDRRSLVTFITLIVFPYTVKMFLIRSPHTAVMGFFLILFYILIVYISLRMNRLVVSNLEFRETNRKIMEDLKEEEKKFRSIFEQAPAGICYYGGDLIIRECNQELSLILKTPLEKLINLDMHKLKDKNFVKTLEAPFKGESGTFEGSYNTLYSGESLWINLKCSLLDMNEGTSPMAVAILENRTEMHRIEEKISHMAYHDSLTGLPNRVLLKDRIGQALLQAGRQKNFGALLFLDLDNFKSINDSLGHDVGDLLLISAAGRIKNLLREEDTVARIGGDEFVVVLPKLHPAEGSSMSAAGLVAEKIHLALSEPFILKGKTLYTSTSTGIVLFSGEMREIDTLLKNADTAMYEAKREGRGKTHFYNIEMNQNMQKRLTMENCLRKALSGGELTPHFQPIVQRGDKDRVCGAETLLRWYSKELGFVSPGEFIPLAEETGMIMDIGEWLIREACSILSEWKNMDRALLDYLSVNISVNQLQQKSFAPMVLENIGKYGISPESLVLEITENVFAGNFEKITSNINELRNRGIRFALDDFGTGYSSLTYLKQMELDIIKIDRSFIRDMCGDSRDRTLVQAVQAIAENFRYTVVAEGVEEKEQVDLLDKIGCTYIQGFYYSKPMSRSDFERFTVKFNS